LRSNGPDAGERDAGGGDTVDAVTDGQTDARPHLDVRIEIVCLGCPVGCGNGVLDPGEQCDDGNKQPGDGCTAICQVLEGWTCPVLGQPCIPDPNPDANPNP